MAKLKVVDIKLEYSEYISSGGSINQDTSINAYVTLVDKPNEIIKVGLYKVENIEKAKKKLEDLKRDLVGKEFTINITDVALEKHYQEFFQYKRNVSGNYAKTSRKRYPTRLYNAIRYGIINSRRRITI